MCVECHSPDRKTLPFCQTLTGLAEVCHRCWLALEYGKFLRGTRPNGPG